MKNGLFQISVKDMCEMGIFVALAILCDQFVKIPFAPTGGSLNFSTLFLFIIAIRHGWFKTLLSAGVVFGVITCALDGYGFVTYPAEYLIAFGSIAITSLFAPYIVNHYGKSKKETLISYGLAAAGVVSWAVIRLFAATFDSMVVWNYDFVSSIVYNLGYVLISAALVLVLFISVLHIIVEAVNPRYPTCFLNDVLVKDEVK